MERWRGAVGMNTRIMLEELVPLTGFRTHCKIHARQKPHRAARITLLEERGCQVHLTG